MGQSNILSGMICIQTVYKCYQQMTKAGKTLNKMIQRYEMLYSVFVKEKSKKNAYQCSVDFPSECQMLNVLYARDVLYYPFCKRK